MIAELISKYQMQLHPDGDKIQIPMAIGKKMTEPEMESIRDNKPAIIAEFVARKNAEIKAREDATARLAANVPGLDALRDARSQWSSYHDAFSRAIDRGDCRMPSKPVVDAKAIAEQYPAAVAYLKAESYEHASHYAKSAAGRKAKQAIADGADYAEALAKMEAEWSAHCEEHIWD